jgi:hypothetical protein
VVAKLLGAIEHEGEERISEALRDILKAHPNPPKTVVLPVPTVPLSLSCYAVESGHAADYDRLLEEASGE